MLQNEHTILITCGGGLAEFLKVEVESEGLTVEALRENGVQVRGSLHDCMKLNLILRTATNVFLQVHECKCRTPGELYEQVSSLPWEELISPSEYLTVVSRVNSPSIDNSMFASLKVKDAIVDRMSKQCGSRPSSGPKRENVVLQLYWHDELVRIYINTSGQKLTDRGYRKIPHSAPLRESLAAALIQETGYDGSEPLINPMCGSGTLAIEAALIAARRPPGLLRSNFGFMHLLAFDHNEWKQLRQTIASRTRTTSERKGFPKILASDIDPAAVEAARKNAMTAGVEHYVDFEVCDFADTPVPEGEGIVILNPEYGLRLGQQRNLEEMYSRIGDFLKQKCSGYTGYVFTGNLKLAKHIGLRTSRRIPFFNADIECRLLKYEMYSGSRKKAKGT